MSIESALGILESIRSGTAIQTQEAPQDLDSIVSKYATQFSVDSNLIHALIGQESGGNPTAVSHAGAIGTMQLMPSTARGVAAELGEPFDRSKLTDPDTNIRYGTYLLSSLLNKNNGDKSRALAEYHGGAKAVLPDGSINPMSNDGITSTVNYVKSILAKAGTSEISGDNAEDILASITGKKKEEEIPQPPQERPISSGVTREFVEPGLGQKADIIASVAMKRAADTYLSLANLALKHTPAKQAMQSALDKVALTSQEMATIEKMGLPGKVAETALELMIQAPLFGGAGAAGKMAVRGIISKAAGPALKQALPVVAKIRPGASRIIQDVAGDMIGFGGLGAAEATSKGATGAEIAKTAGSYATMAGAGRVAGTVARGLSKGAPALVQRGASAVGGAAGFGAGTAVTGGNAEEILQSIILGGGMGIMHPTVKTGKEKPYGLQEKTEAEVIPKSEPQLETPIPIPEFNVTKAPEGIVNRQMLFEKDLSQIKDASARERLKARLQDKLLGEYGVTTNADFNLAQKELEAKNIPYTLEFTDVGNMGGANEAAGHEAVNSAMKQLYGDILAKEAIKRGAVMGRGSESDEMYLLWPNYSKAQVKQIRDAIEENIIAKRDELGFADTKNPKQKYLETGALHTDYGFAESRPGKYGEMLKDAENEANHKKVDFYLAKTQELGYNKEQGVKNVNRSIPKTPGTTGQYEPVRNQGVAEQKRASATEQSGILEFKKPSKQPAEISGETAGVEGPVEELTGTSASASAGRFAERANKSLVEMPELVEMAKKLSGNDPTVKKSLRAMHGTALGLFRHGTKGIELRADLFKEPEQAAKTLSHEIGHLIDYLPDEISARGNILGRIATLKKYLKGSLLAEPPAELKDFYFTSDQKIYKSEIMDELKTLSRLWKPFDAAENAKYTKYRYKPSELYADAFSVLLNEPAILKSHAPKFYDSLFSYMKRKPEVESLYNEIQSRIEPGKETVFAEREKRTLESYREGEAAQAEAAQTREGKRHGFFKNVVDLLWDADAPLKRALSGKQINPESNPLTMVRESRYIGSEIENLLDNVGSRVLAPLYKSGLTESDLGQFMQYRRGATERAGMANPLGMGEKFADSQLEYMKKKMGDKKYADLEAAAENYWNVRNELIIPKLEESKMYSKELMDKIKDNKNYATFNVLEYIEGEGGGSTGISGTIRRQIGTLKAVSNPFTATVLKDSMLLRAAQKNKTIKSFIEIAGNQATPSQTRWVNNRHEAIEQNNQDFKTVKYYQDGKIKSYDIPRDIADVIDKDPSNANPAIIAVTAPAKILKSIFVQYNPFWIARNVVRDMLNTWRNFDRATLTGMLKFYGQVVPDAFKEVFKSESSPLLQEMKRAKAFYTGRVWSGREISNVESELDRTLMNYGRNPAAYKRNIVEPYSNFMDKLKYLSIEKWGRVSEVTGKAAGYKMVKEKYPEIGSRQRAEMVRRRVGTPDFLTGGRARLLYNNLWLFSNVSKEGWRGAYESYKAAPGKFILKTGLADIAPTIATKALELGLLAGIGGAVGKYFTEYKKLFDAIPENDKTNYNCIPVGQTESGKTVYIPIPKDQNGAVVSGTLRKMLNLAESRNPEDLKEVFSFFSGVSPTGNINPLIEQIFNWNDFLMGTGKPRDFYTGNEILTDQERAAGGWYAWKKMLQYSIGDLGGNIWFKFPDNSLKLESEFEKAYGVPVVGRGLNTFLRVSDRGIYEQLKEVSAKEEKERSEISLDIKSEIHKSIQSGEEVGKGTARKLYKTAQGIGYNQSFNKFYVLYRYQVARATATPEVRAINSAVTTEAKNAVIDEILKKRGVEKRNMEKERRSLKRLARMGKEIQK